MRYSQLDEVPGIGPKRKQELLKKFKSISAISRASLEELREVLPENAAQAVQKAARQVLAAHTADSVARFIAKDFSRQKGTTTP